MASKGLIQRHVDWTVDLIKTLIIIIPIAFVIRTWIYGLYQVPTGSMETTMLVGERFFADKFSYKFWPIKRSDIIAFNEPQYPYSDTTLIRLFQEYVYGPQNVTKRVIGIPGDHVVGTIEEGVPCVYLNGVRLNEPYLNQYPLIPVYYDNSKSIEYRTYDPDKSFSDQPFYCIKEHNVLMGKRIAHEHNWEAVRMPHTPAYNSHGKNVDVYDVVLQDNQYWVMGDNRLNSADARFWGHPLDARFIHGKITFRIWSLDSNESWWILDLLQHPIDFWKRIRWSRCFQTIS